MARRAIEGCRTILTGASSGIGRALAIELARQKARIIVTARRTERLAELAEEADLLGGEVAIIPGDIASDDTRQALVAMARERWGALDLLVNKAGVGSIRDFERSDLVGLRQVMEVNFFAGVELTRLALPLLRRGNKPMIANVSSILGKRGVPHYTEYCASKFAIEGFSEALRAELAPAGIDVLVVSPGPTQSEFWTSLLAEQEGVGSRGEGAVAPQKVALATLRAIRRGRHEIVPNLQGRLLLLLNRFSPRLADTVVARWG
jgi:short-subunit dehydrogenase